MAEHKETTKKLMKFVKKNYPKLLPEQPIKKTNTKPKQ